MARSRKEKGVPGEDRLIEAEYRIMAGEELDPVKWSREIALLAETYPDEFGYLLETEAHL